MANPQRSDVHVDTPLTAISVAYMQDPAGFVADRVFPNVPVQKQSDRYFVYSRADFNRDTMAKRAIGAESAGDGFRLDNTPTYFAEPYALHHDIDDQIRSNADGPLDLDRDVTNFLSQKALLNKENSFVSNFFTTGVWTGANVDVTGVSASPLGNSILQWNDSNSTPIEDVRLYGDTVQGKTGFRPNKLVLGRQVWSKIIDHPDLTDRIKYGTSSAVNPAIVTKQAVAMVFELSEVLVMEGVQNTANEGATEAGSFIAGKNALLVYAAPAPGIMIPTAGYTFSWTGLFGAGPLGQRVMKFRMEWLKSDRVELEMAYAMKVIDAKMGVFFSSIIA
jgi:hypothetical protein